MQLDRFQEPATALFPHQPEPNNFCWCGKEIPPDQDECSECAWQTKIQRMPFVKLFNHLMDEADYFEQEVLPVGELVQFTWKIDCSYSAEKVAKILEAREATHTVEGNMVTFYVGVYDGKLDFWEGRV